jgi:hypothetical protein
MSLVGPSLDMLAAMVEGCPALTEALLDTAFPALMRLLINTDDVGVMGAGVVFPSFVVFSAAFCRFFRNHRICSLHLLISTEFKARECGESAPCVFSRMSTQFTSPCLLTLQKNLKKISLLNRDGLPACVHSRVCRAGARLVRRDDHGARTHA